MRRVVGGFIAFGLLACACSSGEKESTPSSTTTETPTTISIGGEQVQVVRVAHTKLISGEDAGLYLRDDPRASGAEHRDPPNPIALDIPLGALCLIHNGIDPYGGGESETSLAEKLQDPPDRFDGPNERRAWVKVWFDGLLRWAHAAYLEPASVIENLPICND